MSDRDDNRCGSGVFSIPTKLSNFLGLSSACSIHDYKYVNLRDRLLRSKKFKSEVEIRKYAKDNGYKELVKQANYDFKWHMVKSAKDNGSYWYLYPIIQVFWHTVNLLGYEVWLQGVFSDWRRLGHLKRIK